MAEDSHEPKGESCSPNGTPRTNRTNNKRKEISPLATDLNLIQHMNRAKLGVLDNEIKHKYLKGMGKISTQTPNTKNVRHNKNSSITGTRADTGEYSQNPNNTPQTTNDKEHRSQNTSINSSYEDIAKIFNENTNQDEILEKPQGNNIYVKRQPPIFIEGHSTNELIELLKSNQIEEGFCIKNNAKVKKISLWTDSTDNYHKIKTKLIEKNIKFYTFTPKYEKPISIVLKGLSIDSTIDDVSQAITDLNIDNIILTKISILKTKFNSKIFLIQLGPQST